MWQRRILQFQDLLEVIEFQFKGIKMWRFTPCVFQFLKFYIRDENWDTKLQFFLSLKIIRVDNIQLFRETFSEKSAN